MITGRTVPAGFRRSILALVVAIAVLVIGAGAYRHRVPTSAAPSLVPPQPLPPRGRIDLSAGRELVVARPDGGTERVTSMLAVSKRMQFGDFKWDDAGVPPGKVWVRVDLDRQLLSVFRSGQEIGTAVILYGSQDAPTPTGWLRVLAKAKDHYSRTYDAPMPYMLRLTPDGVALHASMVQEGRATHGCIGLPLAFARKLYGAMREGDAVLVVGARPAGS